MRFNVLRPCLAALMVLLLSGANVPVQIPPSPQATGDPARQPLVGSKPNQPVHGR